ncbi:MAG TPA: dihydrolipoyllysine-residue acetyltransferase [Burkholderiaceae bacterium]|nr:dihydrolipoyllysine-residue acetyltransferase [Burkholderiaceae bacterium]
MSNIIEVKVPDIGDVAEVDVIEVLVAEGDTVAKEQSLITVESDKASMEIPSTSAGVVKSLKVKVGDKVGEGSVILELTAEGEQPAASKESAAPAAQAPSEQAAATAPAAPAAAAAETTGTAGGEAGQAQRVTVVVPDIGDAKDVEVIEVMVAVGDRVEAEQSLITVESDKASMEVPSSHAGVVKEVLVNLGDKVNKGNEIVVLETAGAAAAPAPNGETPSADAAPAPVAAMNEPDVAPEAGSGPAAQTATAAASGPASVSAGGPSQLASMPPERHSPTEAFASADVPLRNLPHASPSVRKFARELGVDLTRVTGSGAKNRITHEDVRAFVKQALAGGAATAATAAVGGGEGGLSVLPWPKVDFAKFGEIEAKPLSRIKKISGANLHRNWVMIPHVTNNDQADITELEEFRQQLNKEQAKAKSDVKVTMLAFLIKAVVAALRKFPEFNASLDGDTLVLKKYFHIGFAADTPNGLVVPVVRDADRKGILEIAQETSELARLAREGKLAPAQMQGGCFSISSLGGIGGTHFTPIINAPEVAILGVSRSTMQPVWDGKAFEPRLMLPLSLSYDHRVIDGAAAARFNVYLASLLEDFRRIVL